MSKRERERTRETRYKIHLGGGEEGVVTSLMWQTDLKALPLNITTRDPIIEPLDIGHCHVMSLEPSPRSGLDADLVRTQLPHSLGTQSTPHPQTLALYADWTSTSTVTGCSAKEGPEGKEVDVYIHGAKTFSVTYRVSCY
jgi:hypothetical protein